jgi:hypothetical protein
MAREIDGFLIRDEGEMEIERDRGTTFRVRNMEDYIIDQILTRSQGPPWERMALKLGLN